LLFIDIVNKLEVFPQLNHMLMYTRTVLGLYLYQLTSNHYKTHSIMYIASQFKPAWWAKNPHVQTIFADWLTNTKQVVGSNERLELDDGDFLDVVWTTAIDADYTGPLVVVFHGLEGSVKSHYAHRLLSLCKSMGWPAVIMHFRGCSGEPNRLSRAYHSGETSDARFFLELVTKRFPYAALFAASYSLGGNMLLKYLGEYADEPLLKGAVAISPPLNLSACEARLKSGFSRVYQQHLLSRMKQNLHKKIALIPQLSQQLACDQQLESLVDFRSFDQQVTAVLHGFSSADDYYQKCSAMQYLNLINVPSLIIHAKDDPFMTQAVIPELEQLSTQVTYELSEYGGHVGFITGKYPWRAEFYIDQRIVGYFKSIYSDLSRA